MRLEVHLNWGRPLEAELLEQFERHSCQFWTQIRPQGPELSAGHIISGGNARSAG